MSGRAAPADTALVTGPSALVSGATGFLGGHLALLLQDEGFRVRALTRRTSDIQRLVARGIEIVEGDLSDPASLRRAAAGMRFVFHTAGKVTDWGPREEFFRVNATGTAHVIEACRAAGVERLIHVSSLTVLGLTRDGRTVNEETPYARSATDPYTGSKTAAEKLAREAHGIGGLAVTVIRSGVIWGPGDVTIVPRLADLLRRRLLVLIDGGRNLIGLSQVDNLARGIILAARAPSAAGQLYHLTDGEEITAREAMQAIAAAAGVEPPRLSLPYSVVYALAAALEAAARLTRRTSPPLLTRYGVRLVACHCRYDIGKARRDLGYQPAMTFRQGVAALNLRRPQGDRANHPGPSA